MRLVDRRLRRGRARRNDEIPLHELGSNQADTSFTSSDEVVDDATEPGLVQVHEEVDIAIEEEEEQPDVAIEDPPLLPISSPIAARTRSHH